MNRTNIEISDKLVHRFWSYVEKGPNCWEWKGSKFTNRYGQFRVYTKKVKAHRFSWIINGGFIPEGYCILHKCDNPPCVRPDHLFLGTNSDNTHDAIRKGRAALGKNLKHYCGENHPHSKLTEDLVRKIRRLHKEGKSKYGLARKYGIGETTVGQIVNRITWRHI